VILNPAPAQSLPEELYSLLDLLTPNEREAAQLSGAEAPEAAAAVLLERGSGSVIVTRGEAGALLATHQGVEHIPGYRVQAVDATAAGDAFNGALAVGLARGERLPAAIRFAHAVAALSVTKPGAQPSLPTSEEVRAFLRQQHA
jgi:ribokinase